GGRPRRAARLEDDVLARRVQLPARDGTVGEMRRAAHVVAEVRCGTALLARGGERVGDAGTVAARSGGGGGRQQGEREDGGQVSSHESPPGIGAKLRPSGAIAAEGNNTEKSAGADGK